MSGRYHIFETIQSAMDPEPTGYAASVERAISDLRKATFLIVESAPYASDSDRSWLGDARNLIQRVIDRMTAGDVAAEDPEPFGFDK